MSIRRTLIIPITTEEGVEFPHYASTLAAGADVRAYLQEDLTLLPGEVVLVPTGIKMEIPDGFELQVRPRSGLAFNEQVTVLNTPGTIDADYRGEVKVLLINHGKKPFVIQNKMRIAQLVVAPVIQAQFVSQASLSSTQRGEGGFGHTGSY
ncbi:MAG: dUTP diphosphatase [Candidatus Rhabdochlamydia sp.]